MSRYIVLIGILLFLWSCGGGDDPTPPVEVEPPTSATLLLPANNEICLDGVSLNSMEKQVLFQWQASQNTDSYQLSIRNLETQTLQTLTSTVTSLQATLQQGNPYSWQITSRSDGTSETAESVSWRFYLEGDGIANYAPFPPALEEPSSGATLTGTGGVITLVWSGYDADDESLLYDLYLDTSQATTLWEGDLTNTDITLSLAAGQSYFWRIEVKDAYGNSATSQIHSFNLIN